MRRPKKTAGVAGDTLGDRLKRFRLARGMTQTDLANAVGVSQRVITYYEVEGSPAPEMIVKLADALGITTDELLGRKAPSPRTLDAATRHMRLLRQFKRIEQLAPAQRRTVVQLIDALAEGEARKKQRG